MKCYELAIQECDESGEPSHWLALESTPVQIRRDGQVVWEGQACELAEIVAEQIERLRKERGDIIRSAMLAVSVGGRAHPNRLRSLATHRAIELAIEAAEAKGGE